MIDVYGELAEPSRRCILGELRGGPKTVSELVEATGLKQPNVSNHLARMRTRSIVRAAKVGRLVYYTLATPAIESIVVSAMLEVLVPSRVHLPKLANEYATHAIDADHCACCKLIDKALSSGLDMLGLYQDVLGPAMEIVGEWEASGKIDVGQEHIATSITERAMGRISQMTCPRKKHDGVALLGCAAGAWHTLGLRMFSDYLRLQGWRTVFLGANVPTEAFLSAVERHQPTIVLVSCGAEDSVASTLDLVAALRGSIRDFKLGLGGWAVRNAADLLKAASPDFSADDLRSFAKDCLPELERGTAESVS